MNISGLIIKINISHQERIITELQKISECEVHAYEGSKVVITLECPDLNTELMLVKHIESIKNVVSVEMVYTYNEDELEDARSFLENSSEFPKWLNDDTIQAGNIKYQGDLKKKL